MFYAFLINDSGMLSKMRLRKRRPYEHVLCITYEWHLASVYDLSISYEYEIKSLLKRAITSGGSGNVSNKRKNVLNECFMKWFLSMLKVKLGLAMSS